MDVASSSPGSDGTSCRPSLSLFSDSGSTRLCFPSPRVMQAIHKSQQRGVFSKPSKVSLVTPECTTRLDDTRKVFVCRVGVIYKFNVVCNLSELHIFVVWLLAITQINSVMEPETAPPPGPNPKLAWRNGCVRLSWMNCELGGTPAVSRRQQAGVVSTNTQLLV